MHSKPTHGDNQNACSGALLPDSNSRTKARKNPLEQHGHRKPKQAKVDICFRKMAMPKWPFLNLAGI